MYEVSSHNHLALNRKDFVFEDLFTILGHKQPNPFASDPLIILSLLQEDTNMLQLIKHSSMRWRIYNKYDKNYSII